MPAAPIRPELLRDQLHPPLRPWSRAWRYLLAAAAGIAAAAGWLAEPLTVPQEETSGAALILDFGLGVAALAVLPLRRRYPLAVACLTTAASVVSVAAMGPVTLAVVSMATWRRRAWVVVTASVFFACGI